MIIRALKLQGGSFSQSGRFTGVLPMLGGFLREIGCVNITYVPHVIDLLCRDRSLRGLRHDAAVVFKLFQPFIARMGVATQEEVDQLYEQMKFEMMKDDFPRSDAPLTVWGEKP